MSWLAVVLALVAHMLLTWALLVVAGEDRLVAPNAFPYYYMTTATTIGYGDLSPQTTLGRMVVAFLLMPGSVAFFAAVLTKTSVGLSAYWRRHREGRMRYDEMEGHTVLVGWRGTETDRLVDLLLSDTATDDEGLVLVAEELRENHRPEQMRFVAIATYADASSFARAAVSRARRIIINPPTDDQTLAAVLAVMAHRPSAHVVAHFECDAASKLVKSHYPQVECTRPMTAEVIARAAQDPGSSALTQDLLSSDEGQAQFSLVVPDGVDATVQQVAACLKGHGGIFIGMRHGTGAAQINPADTATVPAGTVVYYLAARRIDASLLRCLAGVPA
ncbi:potassium channel family protein [Lysobacter humi (ex Lee et al. 2017)]